MYSLIEKATIYAKQIDTVISGSNIMVDDALQHRLERLFVVFRKIEALVAKEAKKSLKRSLWKLFQLLTCIDMRLSCVDSSRYVGEFRRLRHSDVRKLEMIAQRTLAAGVISWTGARVDGEVMVVRYIEADSSQQSSEDNSLSRDYTEVIRGLSTVQASHPHVVQLYGLRTGPPEACFSAFRAGTHDVFDFLRRSAENDEGVRARRCLLTSYKILDASWYLKHVHNLAWIPGNVLPDNARVVTVDDAGEPQIGLFDDIVDGQRWERGIQDNLNCHWKGF
ncbi:hypothetical protein EXIGLDRAFT_76637 [Exidia glandulosa HHB12029]|uniref:Protein kinase domain-containing protein n=1 Tax=Exidia glandulosa HHB12029 TaxID=1314781 RepID=A0A166AJ15_EXIGL|nr:hypothetical protein EXIGLDRAFT_76637 [Exidia glandulosa HHB12029]